MPAAIMSCAAPTRALWPENPSTTDSGSPARHAISLKMRGTWLGSSRSAGSASRSTAAAHRPAPMRRPSGRWPSARRARASRPWRTGWRASAGAGVRRHSPQFFSSPCLPVRAAACGVAWRPGARRAASERRRRARARGGRIPEKRNPALPPGRLLGSNAGRTAPERHARPGADAKRPVTGREP